MTVETLEKANRIYAQIEQCKKFMSEIVTPPFQHRHNLPQTLVAELLDVIKSHIAFLENKFEEL